LVGSNLALHGGGQDLVRSVGVVCGRAEGEKNSGDKRCAKSTICDEGDDGDECDDGDEGDNGDSLITDCKEGQETQSLCDIDDTCRMISTRMESDGSPFVLLRVVQQMKDLEVILLEKRWEMNERRDVGQPSTSN